MINQIPPWLLALPLFILVFAAALLGEWLHRRRQSDPEDDQTQEGYILSGTVGLLALLLGFTFALAVDRFDTRRMRVLEEANSIRVVFLQAQTFDQPYRGQLRDLVIRYTDNRIALGSATDRKQAAGLLSNNDQLQNEMWAATLAAVATRRDDVSSTFMASMTDLMGVDAARRAARQAHVPTRVFAVLFIYLIATAIVMGFVMGRQHRSAVFALLALAAMSYLLILDIDHPTKGGIRESQQPMEDLRLLTHGPGRPSG